MSVTTVLVPVLGPEAETLFDGGEATELRRRAERFRARVSRLDAIREDVHALLFDRWEREIKKARASRRGLLNLFAAKEPPRIPSGYDPFVQLFGRSFPVAGESGKAVAQHIAAAVAADDDGFARAMTDALASLDRRAAELFAKASASIPPDLGPSIDAQIESIREAIARRPADLRRAYDACVTLSAWSWPVWRLDGVMLADLARLVGLTTPPERATSLFDELREHRPEIEKQFNGLPKSLEDFAGAGAFWSSTDVKTVAGSLRLYRSKVAKNAVTNGDDPDASLRQLRLLEEAVFYCEAENLALAEAAGIEWHDRA